MDEAFGIDVDYSQLDHRAAVSLYVAHYNLCRVQRPYGSRLLWRSA